MELDRNDDSGPGLEMSSIEILAQQRAYTLAQNSNFPNRSASYQQAVQESPNRFAEMPLQDRRWVGTGSRSGQIQSEEEQLRQLTIDQEMRRRYNSEDSSIRSQVKFVLRKVIGDSLLLAIIIFCIALTVSDGYQPVYDCSFKLWLTGMLTCSLLAFMFFRKIILAVAIILCSKEPKNHYQVGNMILSIIDAILIPSLTIFGIITVSSEEALCCKDKNYERNATYHWWLFCCLFTVIMGTVLSLFNICLCCIFGCYTCQDRAEARINQIHQNQNRRISVPYVNDVMKFLQKDKKVFKDIENVDNKDITCSVCLEKFDDKSEIAQLKCHENHIFHIKCIEGWFKSQENCGGTTELNCPVCRGTVKPN